MDPGTGSHPDRSSGQTHAPGAGKTAPARKRYVRAVGPRLRLLLYGIFAVVAVLGANSAYLASITFLEWWDGQTYQNYFYQYMFLIHLALGLLLLLPFILFGILHMRNAHDRPNRRAVRVGYALFAVSLVLLVSGVVLMRVAGFEIRNPGTRSVAYWTHVGTPVVAVWLYIIHRLAGPRIKWRLGLGWVAGVAVICVAMVLLHAQDPRRWNVAGPREGEQYFHPSLARTATGNFIPARTLMMDTYCQKCHADVYEGWFHSAHRFSSFNNPAYLFSVKETREVSLRRDGDVKASRWCAGCHDPVPFFSGAFDDPEFDLENHPTSQAGITCTTCHAITHVNSTRGNADYTLEEPMHYPFAFSDNPLLQFLNNQLVKAKPEFHKKTFLKPLHQTAEFCSTCHKVSLPKELTQYKDFLRGQNHYDPFLLSGVSGHGARSFYYPPVAQKNCNGCHMPLQTSTDFGARNFDGAGDDALKVHHHLFPAANTGVAHFNGQTNIVAELQAFLRDSLRVDLFGVREGGTIDSPLHAPLRPSVPALKPGGRYLLEVVLRTMKVGHLFTQGTVDSNEIWVQTRASSGDRVLGMSGGLGRDNEVDPWSHFVNVYMLDRDGNRIDRRNAQDIFTPLYNNQIPPGAGQVVHYAFTVPPDQREPITFEVRLNYRKFDTRYMKHVFGESFTNDLPITLIASDHVTLPVEGGSPLPEPNPASTILEWQRWNDYGIGLLLKGSRGSEKGELRQAADAFAHVENLGRPDGPLNLARVYLKEGRLDDAVQALQRAASHDPPAPRWSVAYFSGQANLRNGRLDEAIENFRSVLEDRYPELDERGFDFSKDYIVRNDLGLALFERAKQERLRPERQGEFLESAARQFRATLELDSEDLTAHYNLAQISVQLGDAAQAAFHRAEHEKYRPDDNARDKAIATARLASPAADHAAQAIVIYPLQRPGAPQVVNP